MITFSEYVKLNLDKAYNRHQVNIYKPIKNNNAEKYLPAPIKEKSIDDYLKEINSERWTARIIDDKKILFFNGHYLNITEFAKKIKEIYKNNGYEEYGFSKLSEFDLIRYTTIREILYNEFMNPVANVELDYNELVKLLYTKEIKDFEWKPELEK